MDVHIDVTGDHLVGLRFEEFPDGLYQDLKQEIGALGEELLARVQAATPSRTGKLRAQERLRIFADPTSIKAYVDVAGGKGSQDFAKAAALEYGAHHASKVDAHSMQLDHYWSLKLAAPEMVLVAAYTRTPNVMEVAYERGSLADLQPEVLARLNAVVAKRVAAANG